MIELKEKIQALLGIHLGERLDEVKVDQVDVVPIPMHGDRMVRLRTLEEMLDDFETSNEAGTVGYFVQIKTSGQASIIEAAPVASSSEAPALEPALMLGICPDQPSPLPEDHRTDERAAETETPRHEPSVSLEPESSGIYLTNGQLNVAFLLRNAGLLIQAREYVLARNIYKTVLASNQKTAEAHFGMAFCYEAEGKPDEATDHYEQSIAYEPHLDTYQRLGALLLKGNKDLHAAEIMERALNLKGLDPQTRFDLHKAAGNCFTRVQRPEQAETHFKKAIEIHPDADGIRSNLGVLFLQCGKMAEAKRHFQDATASNPNNPRALTGLASCFLAEGDKKSAHDHFAKALTSDLNNPTAIFHLIKCAYELKTYATAAKILADYVQIAPVNKNLLYSLAGLQFHLGRLTDAQRTARRTLEIAPEHSGAKDLMKLIEEYSKS